MADTPRWKIVYFVRKHKKLERKEKLIWNPKSPAVTSLMEKLQQRGIKAHIVCRRYPKFPARGEPEDPDMMWCPYCRRWRFFKIPKNRPPFTALEIKCCAWCQISEDDFSVRKYNGTWYDAKKRRRRGKKRRKR